MTAMPAGISYGYGYGSGDGYGYGYGADEAQSAGAAASGESWIEPAEEVSRAPAAGGAGEAAQEASPPGDGADEDQLPRRVDVAPSTRRKRATEAEK